MRPCRIVFEQTLKRNEGQNGGYPADRRDLHLLVHEQQAEEHLQGRDPDVVKIEQSEVESVDVVGHEIDDVAHGGTRQRHQIQSKSLPVDEGTARHSHFHADVHHGHHARVQHHHVHQAAEEHSRGEQIRFFHLDGALLLVPVLEEAHYEHGRVQAAGQIGLQWRYEVVLTVLCFRSCPG
jgi:hypothetical protein